MEIKNPANASNTDRELINTIFHKIMKFQFSLPTDERFYNDYAQLTPTLRKLGVLAQLVSATTEIGVIFAIIRASLSDFLPNYATTAAIAGAIAATLFIEMGLRQFLPHAVRAILYRHYTGLHLPMTVFIWITCAVLMFASGALSFKGSREMVATVAPRPTPATDATVLAVFRQDSATTAERYAITAQAIQNRTRAEVTRQREALVRLEAKERTGARRYTTAKAAIREKIATIEANAAREIATMATTRAADMATAQERLVSARNEVNARNTEAEANAASKVKNYGLGLGWFSLLALFILVAVISLDEIIRKGAGIEKQAQPTQWDFSQGITAEFLSALDNKWQYHARGLIRKIADATPPPPAPADPVPLWDIEPALIRRKKTAQASIPMAFYHGTQGANATPTQTVPVSNNQGQNGTTAPKTAENTDTNPRRPIGFDTKFVSGNFRHCEHCANPYEHRHHKQRFCSDSCRIANWIVKKGRRPYFKPGNK